MKTICFYFQVHQPFRLKNYRFFEIGQDHEYFDDFSNKSIMQKVAKKCYLPMNNVLYKLIKEYGTKFKISFSISGVAIEQFERYAPEVLDSFKKLAKTGSVEFLAETYSHSLSALKSKNEFERQVKLQVSKIKEHFGQTPQVFRNTELIYSDEIGNMVADMGYKAMLTEGAKHILGWRSPNFLYYNALNPKLKILLKNYVLSDDIAFRFSNRAWEGWPLTTEKYLDWLKQLSEKEKIINLFMDYETFGEHQWEDTGIFEFMKALPGQVFSNSDYEFLTPSEVADKYQPVAAINAPHPISWADEERDLTAWLGNEMQDEAFDKLYSLEEIVNKIDDEQIQRDWLRLQTSDHFYYLCTKFFSDGDVHMYFNPYDNPYNAFINYMNILSDFILRLENATKKDDLIPETKEQIEKNISGYLREIEKLKNKLILAEKLEEKKEVKKKVTPETKKQTTTKKLAPQKETTAKSAKKVSTLDKNQETITPKTKAKTQTKKSPASKKEATVAEKKVSDKTKEIKKTSNKVKNSEIIKDVKTKKNNNTKKKD